MNKDKIEANSYELEENVVVDKEKPQENANCFDKRTAEIPFPEVDEDFKEVANLYRANGIVYGCSIMSLLRKNTRPEPNP